MQLGKIIRDFSDEARAGEVLIACGDLVLLARIGEVAGRFDETVGEYATGAVQRFANLASSEDWLALMNAIERADDPAGDGIFLAYDRVLHRVRQRQENHQVERIQLRQFALAEKPQQDYQDQVDDDRAQQLLNQRKRQLKHVVDPIGRHGTSIRYALPFATVPSAFTACPAGNPNIAS